MAASASAVGLGNIWGFPTNAATNGGAAFLFVYLILSFALAYPALMAELIISGWMIAFFFDPLARMAGMDGLAQWLTQDGVFRNSLFVIIFMLATVYIISAGVKDGIEKWASLLMPSLIVILVLLIFYVMTVPGALEGVRA